MSSEQESRQQAPGPADSPPVGLRERAQETLGFPAVRERLAAHSTFPLGREAALALTPSADPDTVELRQQETAEARRCLDDGWSLDLSTAEDVRGPVERAAKGGLLSGPEVRQVGETLRAARLARGALQRRRRGAPLLSSLGEGIPDLRDLEERIGRSVSPSGEVEDAASPHLREVRSSARVAYGRLEDALQRMLRSPLGREALQEALITERSGRLVVPVRVEARRRLPGLVHDVSDSGATIFVEPMATVSLGNRWRELQLAEAREVERVLRELSSSLAESAGEVRLALGLLARLDLAMARGRYARALDARAAASPGGDLPYLRLVEARHPLLRGRVVPTSLELGPAVPRAAGGGWSVLVITGPNAGGKTVALKTVGLLALMHQAGLQVPAAEGTVLPLFDGVYADIGDQQSIEESLSTFSSHMTTVRAIMAEATPRSLVLLDEVGSSTDPEEGAALAKSVLEFFLHAGIPLAATTHQRGVAAFAQEKPGIANASVELDPVTLAPTYRLTLGLPGRSYALAIASRLGLPPAVLERARTLLEPLHRDTEELLVGIQQERQAAAERRAEAEAALAEAEALRGEAEEQLERLHRVEEEMLQGVRGDLQARAEDLMERLRVAERTLDALPAAPSPERAAALREAQAGVRRVRREARSRAWRPRAEDRVTWLRDMSPGDAVQVRGFPGAATLIAVPDAHGMAEVAVGALRARIPQEHLLRPPAGGAAGVPAGTARPPGRRQLRGRVPEEKGEGDPPGGVPSRAVAALELDLRGRRVDEALALLEPFLDRALLQGASAVRVVHGTGTGALRAALRERLGGHPAVRAWLPEEGRGSDGATVVEMA